MTTTAPRPPAQVEPLVEALGVEDAVRFLLAFGGAELSIPNAPKGRSPVARLLGRDKARALSDVAHLLPRRIPLAKPWIAQVRRAEGQSVAAIARELHASDVAVRGWLKAARLDEDPRQPRLL